MARLYLGIALILVAVGYQYREEIQKRVLGATRRLQTFQPGDAEQASKEPETLKTEPQDLDDTIAVEKNTDYYNPPFDPNDYTKVYTESGTRMITRNELAAHGHSGPLKPVWLAVMGRVYDVSKGEEHYYGPKGGYNFFTGKDGSRAYVTGEFNEEGLIDDVEGLNPLQLGELDSWVKFYDKDYSFVGKLIGRYYKKDGSPTKAWYKYLKALGEREKIRAEQKALEKKFPGCNSKWTQEDGGTVFCSEKSGGIHRDWVGYPRRYFAPGSTSWRCACVNENDLSSPHVKLYPDCNPKSVRCKVNAEKLRQLRG